MLYKGLNISIYLKINAFANSKEYSFCPRRTFKCGGVSYKAVGFPCSHSQFFWLEDLKIASWRLLEQEHDCEVFTSLTWWQSSSQTFSSVGCSVVSDSSWPHGLHARPPCPSPTARACSNSCPLSWWYHPTISSSVVPFSCPQSFPAAESFPVTQCFTSVDQ